jgi:hypothetical protein
VLKVIKVSKVQPVPDHLVVQVLKVLLVPQVLKVFKVPKVFKEQMEL